MHAFSDRPQANHSNHAPESTMPFAHRRPGPDPILHSSVLDSSPLDSSPLGGFDALLATVQMPPGVPVAAVGVGSMGAKNAGHLAVAILALQDDALRGRLLKRRKKMAEEIVGKAATLRDRLRKVLEGS